MRFGIRLCVFPLVFVLLLLVAPASAQQITFYPDFSNVSSPSGDNHLQFNGNGALANWQSKVVLRLTDSMNMPEQSSTFFDIQQPLTQGFTTWFQFQIHNNDCCMPGDGFAFVIQNSNNTNVPMGASGIGMTALGAGDGGLGYAGLNNSLAIEFDVLDDPWDPNSDHIAIQTCGGVPSLFNTPVHLPGVYTIGQDNDVTSCLLSQGAINTAIPTLGGTCNGSSCTDGIVHQVVIQYTPPAPNQLQGVLQVWLDPTFIPGTHTPILGAPTVLSVPYNIVYSSTNPNGLALANVGGRFWVGFTASQPPAPGSGTTQDIFAWEFTTHSPGQVTQVIPAGGIEADYAFGGHQAGVTYPSGFTNPTGITMTVLETPWNQQTFYTQRLLGTQFADENCIIYLETGGNCIVYSVTCQDANGNNVTCPTEPDPTIAICTQFYTSEPIAQNTADFLSADPIGSNNWCSIFVSFMNDPIDPVVSGKGTGFSDLVATFSQDGQGPACNSGSLKKLTQKMKSALAPGPGFCPALQ
jgi:hypothetical protein